MVSDTHKTDIDDNDLPNRIDTLAAYSGHGTQLVSLYVPPDRRLEDVRQRLTEESADAANIKAKQTRKRVQTAITKARNALHGYESTPETGMIVFSGVLDDDGDEIVVCEVFDGTELPLPVESYRYHCSDEFLVAPLRTLCDTRTRVGLVVLDLQQAQIGWMVGSHITHLETLTSHVPGKHRAGGQSAPRFRRRRREAIHEFLTRVGKSASNHFRTGFDCEGIVIGGPSPTRKAFADGDFLHHELRDEVLGVVSVADATVNGLHRLADEATTILTDHEYTRQRDVVDQFLSALREECAAYGREMVETALEYNAVETLLVAPDAVSDADVDTIVEQAREQGGDVVTIQTGFDKGEQFRNVTDGYGAILRFPIE